MEKEIRKEYLSQREVILAPGRGKRPHQFTQRKEKRKGECPFCRDSEDLTPPPIKEIPGNQWKVRLLPNKYPILNLEGKKGYGKHEVLSIISSFMNWMKTRSSWF